MVRTECDDSTFQWHFFRMVHPSTFAIREERLLTVHTYCESSISLEGGCSKDRIQHCCLSTSFQECPHQKLFFDLKDKNYKKAKMKGGLGWMKKYRE